MANTALTVGGLIPINSLDGHAPMLLPMTFQAVASAAIYPNNPVKLYDTGTANEVAECGDGTADVTIGTAMNYVAAADTDRTVRVLNPRGVIYLVQGGSSTGVPVTAIGLCADTVIGTGATYDIPNGGKQGYSKLKLAEVFGTTGQYKVLGFAGPPNDPLNVSSPGANAWVYVMLNEGFWETGKAGITVS